MPRKLLLIFLLSVFALSLLNSCKGGDARKNPPDPRERVKRNLEEGRGFRLDTAIDNVKGRSGNFEFASSNELWRASLDIIDFMPLLSANYSGGIIITDWYSENQNEAIKVTIRFLTNEIRSDSIDLKIFYRICNTANNCTINERKSNLADELKKEILKKATVYEKTTIDKRNKKKELK